MQITHTVNQDETSVTVERENGSKIDFCQMNNELVIGETQGDNHHQIKPRQSSVDKYVQYPLQQKAI